MSSITDKLIKGSAWLSFARAIVNLLSIISMVAMARLLSPDDFGVVAVATTLMLLVTEVTELSLAQALVRHRALTDAHFHSAFTMNALRGGVLGGALALAGSPLASFYDDPRLVGIMAGMGASVFLGGLANPRRIVLQRELIFWQEFVLNVSQKLVGVVASVVVAYIFRSYWALVVGIVATQLTTLVVSYTVMPYRPRLGLAHAKDLLSFSVWVSAVQIVNTLNWRFDTLFIGKLLGNEALGHYSVGGNLAAIPTREATTPLRQTFYPAFSSMRDDRERLSSAYQRAQAVVTAIALPAGIGAALVADPLIRLGMGEKWVPAIFIVQALASVHAVQTLGSSADALGMALGQTRLLFVRSVQMLVVRIPLIVGAMYLYGLEGVIGARVFTGLIATVVNMVLVRRLINVSVAEQLAVNARSFCAAAVMVIGTLAVVYFLPARADTWSLALEILVLGATSILLYSTSCRWLWRRAGRPSGPEQEIGRLMAKVWKKLRPGSADA
ncbi:lipopolysaccharide biosynthesis protein [Pseudorhodoferax soli]|uniref:PST family polysaccharide transporter n=1 Tax=Pseudorhodoferax soli TaxID=545864 RepID=A0A368Y737_9BURK|nr:lipopolysaccharide biosynthesis protein [Pseudorhodoferax soli]RCW76032.1 PST family polysaccharide transporter [Pseudorhodoferax soli]